MKEAVKKIDEKIAALNQKKRKPGLNFWQIMEIEDEITTLKADRDIWLEDYLD